MTSRPNVLIVMSDEQSWSTMGCTGNPAAHTPHLDALCEGATSFDRCFTPFPLCCPSRASLWTALMPRHHGVLGNWRPIEPAHRAAGLARSFVTAGYHTAYCGKWHVPGTTPTAMGWRDTAAIPAVMDGRDRGRYITEYREHLAGLGYDLDPSNMENLTRGDVEHRRTPGSKPYGTSEIVLRDYLECWQTEQLLIQLERRPRDRPWLAACSYNAPHFPMVVPRPYDSLIRRDRVVLPPTLGSGPTTKPKEVRESHFAAAFEALDQSDWVEVIAHYLGLCSLIDDQVGRIVEYLQAEGEWDRTVVVFTSDHGDMMGAHGLMEKGHLLHYEETLRVPLLIRHPGQPSARTQQLVSVCDVAPTLADLAGVEWPEGTDGKSFAASVGGPPTAGSRRWVTAETALRNGSADARGEPFRAGDWCPTRDQLNLSVRTPTARYVWRSHDEDELYDLGLDPHEQVNRACEPTYSGLRQELRAILADEARSCFPIAAAALACT